MIEENIKRPAEIYYLPKILMLRLKRRDLMQIFLIIYSIINIHLFIECGLFFHAAFNTNKYVTNGDEFWDLYRVQKLRNKEIPYICGFAGTVCASVGVLNWMNTIVCYRHMLKGGLKTRIVFMNYFHIAINTLLLICSAIPIGKYGRVVRLFPPFIILGVFNLIVVYFFFWLNRRVLKRESPFMLPMKIMMQHREEYFKEYCERLKTTVRNNENNVIEMKKFDDQFNNNNMIVMNNINT